MKILKILLISVFSYLIVGCATDPTVGLTPVQIAQQYEYKSITPVDKIETRAAFSFQYVNSKSLILDYGRGFEYLVTLKYSCFNLRSDASVKTNATDNMTLTSTSSLIVSAPSSGSSDQYCQVNEIFKLEK